MQLLINRERISGKDEPSLWRAFMLCRGLQIEWHYITVPFIKTLCCDTRVTLSMPRPLSFLKQLDFLPCLFEYLSSLTHSTSGKVLNFPELSHVLLSILTACVLFEDKTASHVLVKIKLIFYFLSRKIVLNIKYI